MSAESVDPIIAGMMEKVHEALQLLSGDKDDPGAYSELTIQFAYDILAVLISPNAIRDKPLLRSLVVESKISQTTDKALYEYFLNAFTLTGAIYFGHFELLSGRHSNYFFRFSRIGSMLEYRESICQELFRRLQHTNPTLIMGPVSAGGLLVNALSEAFNVQPAFFDLDLGSRPAAVRTGYSIPSASRIILVNDVATTGEGLERMIKLVEYHNAQVVGIGLFATRGVLSEEYLRDLMKKQGIPIESIVHLNIESTAREECTQCRYGKAKVLPYSSYILNS